MTKSTKFDDIARPVFHLILGSLGIAGGGIAIYNSTTKEFNLHIQRSIKIDSTFSLPDIVVESLKTVSSPHTSQELVAIENNNTISNSFNNSDVGLLVPLSFTNELLGILIIGTKFSKEEFNDSDKQLLQTMANCLTSSLKNTSLVKTLLKQKNKLNKTLFELETFFDTGRISHEVNNLEQLFEDLLFRGISLMNSSGGILFLKQQDSPICKIGAILCPNEDQVKKELFTKNYSLFKQCEELKTCLIKNNEIDKKLIKSDWTNLIIAPIIGPQAIHGYFVLGDKETMEGITLYSDDDAQIMEVISMQAGIAIENRMLIQNLEKEKTSVQNILRGIGNGIITLNIIGEIDSFNENIEKILDKTKNDLLNHPFQYVFDGNPKLIDIISRCIESNHSIVEHNTTYNGIDFIRNINFSARPLISGDGLVVGVIIIIENITEELRVRNMFKRYVSEAIVDQIIDNKLDLGMGGMLKDVCILFADIRGFTAMSENMMPDEVVNLLNDYFNVMIDIIFKNNGLLDKIVGDELMVVFGSPVEDKNKHDNAVKTAVEMMIALDEFNISKGRNIEIGIGINSGKVISGNIGSEERTDFTVIGDNVNLASRLCSNAKSGEILISKKVKNKLVGNYRLKLIKPFMVKGKSEKINAFNVIWTT